MIQNVIQNKNINTNTNDLSLNRKNNLVFGSNNNRLERQPQADAFSSKKIIKYGMFAAITLTGIAKLLIAKGKHIKNIFGFTDKKAESAQIAVRESLEEAKKAKAKLEQQVKEYFQAEEKELLIAKQKISESNARNEQWLEKQHNIKEKEYSDFWNKKLAEKNMTQIFNDIKFDKKISEDCFGNKVNLNYYLKRIKQSELALKALKECENLTFDTPNLKLIKNKYDNNNAYDLGLRYAIVANNTAKVNGSAVITNEIPEMFKGINKDELIKSLDELPSYLERDKINKFTINGKEFRAQRIGSGCINIAYKITDSHGNKICYKYTYNPYLMRSGQGIFNEVAIMQEAQKAGVTDIPKLYMANPVGCIAQLSDLFGTTTKGGWVITELIESEKIVPQNGLKFLDWLDTKGLYCGDLHSGNLIGGIIIDMGGICDKAGTVNKIRDEANDITWLFQAYHGGKSTSEIIKEIELYSKKPRSKTRIEK